MNPPIMPKPDKFISRFYHFFHESSAAKNVDFHGLKAKLFWEFFLG